MNFTTLQRLVVLSTSMLVSSGIGVSSARADSSPQNTYFTTTQSAYFEQQRARVRDIVETPEQVQTRRQMEVQRTYGVPYAGYRYLPQQMEYFLIKEAEIRKNLSGDARLGIGQAEAPDSHRSNPLTP